MNQKSVREKVNSVITSKGVTQSFLCQEIGIPNSVMSKFVNGKKELYPEHLTALNDFVTKNYQ